MPAFRIPRSLALVLAAAVIGGLAACGWFRRSAPPAVASAPAPAQTPQSKQDVKIRAMRETIAYLDASVRAFKGVVGRYPTTEEGLRALSDPPVEFEPPVWESAPPRHPAIADDYWFHPLRYRCSGARNPEAFDVWSAGPDGIDGTPDDIGNWD